MTITGSTVSQLMECPACAAIVTANVTVSSDTDGAEIIGGLLYGRLPCDGCGTLLGMAIRVRGADQ